LNLLILHKAKKNQKSIASRLMRMLHHQIGQLEALQLAVIFSTF